MEHYITDEYGPARNKKLHLKRTYDDYPDWATFEDDEKREYSMKFSQTKKVEDKDDRK